jgi:hypothetical protein
MCTTRDGLAAVGVPWLPRGMPPMLREELFQGGHIQRPLTQRIVHAAQPTPKSRGKAQMSRRFNDGVVNTASRISNKPSRRQPKLRFIWEHCLKGGSVHIHRMRRRAFWYPVCLVSHCCWLNGKFRKNDSHVRIRSTSVDKCEVATAAALSTRKRGKGYVLMSQ